MTPKPTQESRTLHLLNCKGAAAHPNPVPLRVGVRMDARLQHRVIAGSNAGREQPRVERDRLSLCACSSPYITLERNRSAALRQAGSQPGCMQRLNSTLPQLMQSAPPYPEAAIVASIA